MEQLSSKRDLPEDILEQIILPRLPPKSLGRFMCVSKSWYNLIKSPSFISKQLSWSKQHSKPSLLFRRAQEVPEMFCFEPYRRRYDLLSLVVGDDDDDLVSNVSLPLGGMWTRCRQHLEIAGHCDGIVCLRLCLGNLVLCNPTIKDFKLVPKSCHILPEEESVTHGHIMSCRELLGFGYDPKGKDYKVIRCVQMVQCFHEVGYWIKAEVYTMGTNSWRQISWYDPSRPIRWQSTQQWFFNGIYYWNVIILTYCILSFDMGDDVFREISFPLLESNRDVRYHKMESCLSVWKDETSISLVTPWLQKSCGSYVNFDIWLLNNNSCVWTKHLTLTTKQQVEEPYGPIRHVPLVVLWRSDQLLTAEEDGRVIVSYDLAGNKEQGRETFKYHLPMSSAQPYYSYHQAILYVNSLVPVTGGHKLEGMHKSDFYAVEQLNRGYESKNDYQKNYIQICSMILKN